MESSQKLSPETIKLLWRVYRQSKNYQVRIRAQCILLMDSQYEIQELSRIFGVSRRTIYNWKNNWSKYKLVGLYDRVGRGRKEILNSEQKEKIKLWSKQYQNSSRQIIVGRIRQEWGITVSKDTITRVLGGADRPLCSTSKN